MSEARLILDTCALLWLASGDPKLTASAKQAIDRASLVLVSAISAWEIGLKVARDELVLPLPPDEWFEQALTQHRLLLAPLDVAVLVRANQLPWHHRDPADRFIIATAQIENAAVVTADAKFLRYEVRVIGCG